jgi:transposase-like protein
MSRAPLSEDAVAQARSLIASGVSVREVARALGCSDTGLRRRLAANPAPDPSSASERARALVARQYAPASRPHPPPLRSTSVRTSERSSANCSIALSGSVPKPSERGTGVLHNAPCATPRAT